MGRTVPTFTNIIDGELQSWSKFRRGMRIEDQEVFDEIFRAAKQHLAENFYAMRSVPFESIVISILVEQGKRIRTLERKMQEAKSQETNINQETTAQESRSSKKPTRIDDEHSTNDHGQC